MQKIDKNGDGKLSMEEFIQLCSEELQLVEIKKRIGEKFKQFDLDNSGFLPVMLVESGM